MARTKQTARMSTGGKSCGRMLRPMTPAQRRRAMIKLDAVRGITTPTLRRLARRGGVLRTRKIMFDDMRAMLKNFIGIVVRNAALYAGHGYRNTVTKLDVKLALKRSGVMLYDYSAPEACG
ncbi:Histone H4 [Mycena kentingensis (nom. inval.)]|nr:Histone H4 [Mycena kentingensis (nom. inval.)]